jgi:hypothetical protein
MPKQQLTKGDNSLEKEIIDNFFLPIRKARYFSLLETSGGRDKIKRKFPHFPDFDPRHLVVLPSGMHKPDHIITLLNERGAKDQCYVWSEGSEFDGMIVGLKEVLPTVVGWEPGTIILCLPGHVGYFEGEGRGCHHILKR